MTENDDTTPAEEPAPEPKPLKRVSALKYVGETNPDGEPIPVDDESSPVPSDVAQQAIAELARLKGPLGGLPEILRELDMNLEVPGEGYLVGLGAREEVAELRTPPPMP